MDAFYAGCDTMVCFMLMDRQADSRMRMEMDDTDAVSDICDIISGCWSCEGFVLRNGYTILDGDDLVRDCIGEGDVIDIVPDPDRYLDQSQY